VADLSDDRDIPSASRQVEPDLGTRQEDARGPQTAAAKRKIDNRDAHGLRKTVDGSFNR
jgi:hypothetical protein